MPARQQPEHEDSATPRSLAPRGPAAVERALVERAEATAAESLAESTRRAYRTGWGQWLDWTQQHGLAALPAPPAAVAVWAQHLHDGGMRADSISVRLAAVSYMHRHHINGDGDGVTNPVEDPRVARVMRGLRRSEAAQTSRQATPLSDNDIGRIEASSPQPRRTRGGHVETAQEAAARAAFEVALIRMMRDGMLRISEAAEARWEDFVRFDDGSATLRVRRSKTDQAGAGAEVWLSPATGAALLELRAVQGPSADAAGARIVGSIALRTLSRRLDAAFRYAGLGSGYSGHSGRVGMAQDLAAAGAGLPAIMTAGRWKSADMPARYTARQAARRGAVADWYDKKG